MTVLFATICKYFNKHLVQKGAHGNQQYLLWDEQFDVRLRRKRGGEKRRLQNSHKKKHDKPFYKKSTYKKIKTLKSPKICNKQDHWPQSWSTYMLMIAVRKCSKNKCPTFLSFQMTINFFKIYQHVILSALITVQLSYE